MLINYFIKLDRRRPITAGNKFLIPGGTGKFTPLFVEHRNRRHNVLFRVNEHSTMGGFSIPVFTVEVHTIEPKADAVALYDRYPDVPESIQFLLESIFSLHQQSRTYPCHCS
jgi:hypothetical protein